MVKSLDNIKFSRRLWPSRELATITIKTGVLIFATIAFFWQDLYALFNNALQNEAASYVLAIVHQKNTFVNYLFKLL